MKRLLLAFVCIFYSLLPAISSASDLLDNAVGASMEEGQMISIGSNPESVGKTIFSKSIGINGVQQPLYVRVIKVILRFTMILGVTMGLLIGIRYIFAQGDEGAQKKLIGYLTNIIYGILIALSAYVIVTLIQSVTQSSVTF